MCYVIAIYSPLQKYRNSKVNSFVFAIHWRQLGLSKTSVKHGGGSVMAWARMAASGVGSLIFIDDVTQDEFRSLKNIHLPTYGEMHPN